MQLQSNHTSRATNILTCLILPYTALQNKHVLACGDYISGVESMRHVQNQSVIGFLCGINGWRSTPTIGCQVLDVQCAERSTRSAGDQQLEDMQQSNDTNLYSGTDTLFPIPYPFHTKMYGDITYSVTSTVTKLDGGAALSSDDC